MNDTEQGEKRAKVKDLKPKADPKGGGKQKSGGGGGSISDPIPQPTPLGS